MNEQKGGIVTQWQIVVDFYNFFENIRNNGIHGSVNDIYQEIYCFLNDIKFAGNSWWGTAPLDPLDAPPLP